MTAQWFQKWIQNVVADTAGQAMAEYAIVVAALMGGLTVMSFHLLPEMIRAFQLYYDGYYIILNLPIP
jgi:hypothetical protein